MKTQIIAALSLLLVAGTIVAGCKKGGCKRPKPNVVCTNGSCKRR